MFPYAFIVVLLIILAVVIYQNLQYEKTISNLTQTTASMKDIIDARGKRIDQLVENTKYDEIWSKEFNRLDTFELPYPDLKYMVLINAGHLYDIYHNQWKKGYGTGKAIVSK